MTKNMLQMVWYCVLEENQDVINVRNMIVLEMKQIQIMIGMIDDLDQEELRSES